MVLEACRTLKIYLALDLGSETMDLVIVLIGTNKV
jgi:hypothetical protein